MSKLAIRSQIVAPPDKYLLSIDLSQAEAWVVAMEADEPRMKNALRKNIMHEQTAQVIFDRPLIEDKKNCGVTKDERFLGKKYNHACNYRMGYLRAAEVINKESDKPPYVTVTSKQSKIYHTKWNQFYDLKRWWLWIENDLRLHHYIITCYGRKIYLYGTLDIELFKKATALRAQSAIADHMFGRVQKEVGVVGGLKKIKEAIVDKSSGAIKIINTSHDSGILEVPKSDIKGVAEECLKYLQRPIVINGEEFTIPADSEYGERWGELEKI